MVLQWVRKNGKGRSQRVPSIPIYLCPHPEDRKSSYFNRPVTRQHLQGEYVLLEHQNVCVTVPVPWLTYMCTGRENIFPKVQRLRPLSGSKNLHIGKLAIRGKTKAVRLDKGGCPLYNLRAFDLSKHKQDHKHNGDSLSKLGDFDERSEAIIEKCANIAMEELNSCKHSNPLLHKSTFDLVECGSIARGYTSDGHIFHFNFKARNLDATDDAVETFFAEIVEIERNSVHVYVRNLGRSGSLPDKAKLYGCLFCSSHNIHHPDSLGYHNGREDLWRTLDSQSQKYDEFTLKIQAAGFVPTLSDPGFFFFGRSYRSASTAFATVALSLFNSRTKGVNFKLVKLCSYANGFSSMGMLVHINFEAKNQDDPDAPLQTFFAEVFRRRTYIFAASCELLDPSALGEKIENHGCRYCAWYCASNGVHHPPGPKYVTGWECLRYW